MQVVWQPQRRFHFRGIQKQIQGGVEGQRIAVVTDIAAHRLGTIAAAVIRIAGTHHQRLGGHFRLHQTEDLGIDAAVGGHQHRRVEQHFHRLLVLVPADDVRIDATVQVGELLPGAALVQWAAHVGAGGQTAGAGDKQGGGISGRGVLAAAWRVFHRFLLTGIHLEVGVHIRLRQVAQRQEHIAGGRGTGKGNGHIRATFIRSRRQQLGGLQGHTRHRADHVLAAAGVFMGPEHILVQGALFPGLCGNHRE